MKPSEAFFTHGCYVKQGSMKDGNFKDAYVGFVKSLVDGHREMVVIPSPEVSVYVTKPQYRLNTIKRECIDKSQCDVYRTKISNMTETLFNAINNPGRFRPIYGFVNPKKVMDNPHVYGADIDYSTHLKYAYTRANKGEMPKSYNVGHLDIETDVTGSQEIILITFMNGDGNTYTGVLKKFFVGEHDTYAHDTAEDIAKREQEILDKHTAQVHSLWEKTEKEFRSKLNEEALEKYDKSDPIKIHLELFDSEVDLIKWVFNRIHECKPDFCTIWNIAYDIPYILDRLKFRGVDPKDVFCHPDVPPQWRMCEFKLDKGKEDSHITDLWSWLHCTDYTLFVDAMCLYGRLRKAKGRDPSYKLNDIGAKEIGAGKLEFGDGEGHATMQVHHPVEYTVYNIVDVLILRVMEIKNRDIFNMVMLSDVSTMDEFHHQSIQLKNSFYVYLDKKGKVPGSVGNALDQPWDHCIDNKGGAVLDPERSFENIAVPSISGSEAIGRVARFVLDLDVTSEYPYTLITMNITRETKLATVLNIDNTNRAGKEINSEDIRLDPKEIPGLKNIDVISWFSLAIYTQSNALKVAKTFNLPTLDELDRIIAEDYPELCQTVA